MLHGHYKGWIVNPMPSGHWQARVKLPRVLGKYKTKTFQEKRQASAWAQDEAAALRVGLPSSLTVRSCITAEISKTYVARLRDIRRSESHVIDVERRLAQLAIAVPDLEAPSAPDAIERWMQNLQSISDRAADGSPIPLSPATRNKILAEVRAMCRWAVRRGKLTKDPTAALDRVSLPDYMPTVFTIAECRRLLIEVDHPYHRLFATMLFTGLRVQEASGLHWEDIDWDGQVVMVRLRTGVRVKRNKERLVPLSPELRTLFDLPWPASKRRVWRSTPKQDQTPMQRRRGAMFAGRGQNPWRGFATFLQHCAVPLDDRSPHSCRHTYGGLMSASGVPLNTLSGYLGHATIATTMIYTKLTMRYEAVARSWVRGQFELLTGLTSPVK